jgi:hypothetical protein
MQRSVVQASSSAHAASEAQQPRTACPRQLPALQASFAVHGSPSSQATALVTGAYVQPTVGEHESAVQGLLSAQSTATWTQPASVQAALVHKLPSSQASG